MKDKKALLYITNDSCWDTDVSILPGVASMFRLEVFCLSPHDRSEAKYPEKKLPENVKFHNCQFGRSKKDPRMIIDSFIYGLRILLASRGKTTVWVMDNNIWYAPLFIGLASAKHVIVSIHNYVDHKDTKKWAMRIKDSALKKFRYFHFHSQGQEEAFKKDYPEKKSFYTTMPVKDYGEPKDIPNFFNNDNRVFLFFGYMRDYKRPDLFIKASNLLKRDANFVIAGHGENIPKYQEMIDADSEMKCMFRFIDNEEIPGLFTSAHFLVLPYDDSSQSGPLLTAYRYGLPVIASDLPYFQSMIEDGKNGYVFRHGDFSSLVEVMKNAIGMSPKQYSEMKNCQRKMADDYMQDKSFASCLNDFLIRI